MTKYDGRCFRRSFLFAFQAFWVLLLTAAAVYKIVESGVASYVRHFTNWSWTLQIAFYALTLPYPRQPNFLAIVMLLLFVPVASIVWNVAILVFIMLADGPAFLPALFEVMQPGIVVLGNDLFHVVPLLALVFYYFLHRPLVRLALVRYYYFNNPWFGSQHDYVSFLSLFLLQVYVWPALPVLLYMVFFDPHQVYDTTLSPAWGIGTYFLVNTLFIGLPVILELSLLPTPRADASTLKRSTTATTTTPLTRQRRSQAHFDLVLS